MAAVADSLIIELRATFDRLAGDLGGATKTLGKFENKFMAAGNLLGKAIGVGATVAAVLSFKKLGDEIGKLAARGEIVGSIEEGFKKLGGSASQIDDASKSLLGMVSSVDLMQIANRGLIAQIPQFNEHFSQITELGGRLADTLGVDTVTAINMVTDAIASGKEKQLASIGIIIDVNQAYRDYAAANNIAAISLDDRQKKEARQIAGMKQLGAATQRLAPINDSVANAQQAVTSAWADAYDKMGKQINASESLRVGYRNLETEIRKVDWDNLGKNAAEFSRILLSLAQTVLPALVKSLGEFATAFNTLFGDDIQANLDRVGNRLGVLQQSVAEYNAKIADETTGVFASNSLISKGLVAYYEQAKAAAEKEIQDLTKTQAELAKFQQKADALANSKINEGLVKPIVKAGESASHTAEEIDSLKKSWEKLQQTANEKSIADGIDDAIKALDQVSFEHWKSELEKATAESVEAALKEGLAAGTIDPAAADAYREQMIQNAIDPVNERWLEEQKKAHKESVDTWASLFENAITGTTFSLKDALKQIAVGFAAEMANALFGSIGGGGSPQSIGAGIFQAIFGGATGGASGGGGIIQNVFSGISAGGGSGGGFSVSGLFDSISGGLSARAPGVEGPLMQDGSFSPSIFGQGTVGAQAAGSIGMAVAVSNGVDAITNLGNSAEDTTDSILTLGGTAIGASIGGPIGAGIGSAIGHVVGDFLGGALFGGPTNPETLARMAAADALEEVINEVAGRGLDAHLFNDFNTPDWATAFQTQANSSGPGGASTFSGVATGLADKMGLDVPTGEFAAMLSDAFGGSMDMLKELVDKTGLTFEELKGSIMKAANDGEKTWLEAFSEIRDSAEAFKPGLTAVGDFVGAMQNLAESGDRGSKTLKAIKDSAIEAGEAGITSFDQWRASLEASGQFSSTFIEGMFQGLQKAGIHSFDQIENASDDTLMAIAAHMDAWLQDNGLSWSDLADQMTGAGSEVAKIGGELDALDGSKATVEIEIKTSIVGEGGSFIQNKYGNIFDGGGETVKFARGAIFSTPHTFPMAGGRTGMLGEAGPEAIMPLKRINGRLGVVAKGTGSSGGTTIINQDFRGAAPGVEAEVRRAMQEHEDRAVLRATRGIYENNRRQGY